jgi:hypothetical protein
MDARNHSMTQNARTTLALKQPELAMLTLPLAFVSKTLLAKTELDAPPTLAIWQTTFA